MNMNTSFFSFKSGSPFMIILSIILGTLLMAYGIYEIFFKNLDGQTMLLYSRIGVWYPMHLETQPHTHFILQDNREVFMDLTQNSTLPTFISDLSIERDGKPDNRKIIPIIDKEATNTFYLVCKKKNKKLLEPLYRAVEKRLEKKKK